jgi:hypothetical protein
MHFCFWMSINKLLILSFSINFYFWCTIYNGRKKFEALPILTTMARRNFINLNLFCIYQLNVYAFYLKNRYKICNIWNLVSFIIQIMFSLYSLSKSCCLVNLYIHLWLGRGIINFFFIFSFHHQFNLVWGQFWHQVIFPSRSWECEVSLGIWTWITIV